MLIISYIIIFIIIYNIKFCGSNLIRLLASPSDYNLKYFYLSLYDL